MGKPTANSKNGASASTSSTISRSSPIPSGTVLSTTASTTRKTFNSTGVVNSDAPKLLRSATSQQHNDNGAGGETVDPSQVNFPYDIRINGFSSLLTSVLRSTEKVRRLILEECELILECRVCRNLFRSLPNFIAHKESYCKDKSGPSSGSSQSNVLQDNLIYSDVNYHLDSSSAKEPASPSQLNAVRKKKPKLDNIVKKLVSSAETGKDAAGQKSGILDRRDYTQPPRAEPSLQNLMFPNGICLDDKPHILLHSLEREGDYKGVMFQRNVTASSVSSVFEGWANTFNAPTVDSAILGADGRIICASDSAVIDSIVTKVVDRIGDQVEEKRTQKWELHCDECSTIFPTRKTLRMHIRSAHRKPATSDDEPDRPQEEDKSAKPNAVSTNSTASTGNSNGTEGRISSLITQFSPQKLNTLQDSRTSSKQSRILGSSLNRQRKRAASGSSSNSSSDSGPSLDIIHGPNGICRKSDACYSEFSRFICAKCSSKFLTVQETSAHKAVCSGVINLIRAPSPVLQQPRTTKILLRKDYSQNISGQVKSKDDSQPEKAISTTNGGIPSAKKRLMTRNVPVKQSPLLNGNVDTDLSEESPEEPCNGDTCSNSSLESPDECMKSSDAEGETDRDSNVTDSGISTSSSLPSQSTGAITVVASISRTKPSAGEVSIPKVHAHSDNNNYA